MQSSKLQSQFLNRAFQGLNEMMYRLALSEEMTFEISQSASRELFAEL